MSRNTLAAIALALVSAIVIEHLPTALVLGMTIFARTVGMFLAWMFVARYARQPLRSTPWGGHLMGFGLVVGCFLSYATVNNIAIWLDPTTGPEIIDGDYPGRVGIGFVLYCWVAFEMYRRNELLSEAIRQGREESP